MTTLKEKARRYTLAFADSDALQNKEMRYRKADKIEAVLKKDGILPAGNLQVLDIGCSSGLILRRLASVMSNCIGVDMDYGAMAGSVSDGLVTYVCADGEKLPFASATFDIIICNHVYEHTDQPERMVTEIYRMLKKEGVCYFSGPNKYDFIEPHYHLPLLSWLPRSLAGIYVRFAGKAQDYVEKPCSYRALRDLIGIFSVADYTGRIIHDPAFYHIEDILPPNSLKQLMARFVYRYMRFMFPDFVFILRKKPVADSSS